MIEEGLIMSRMVSLGGGGGGGSEVLHSVFSLVYRPDPGINTSTLVEQGP
jgi:hypothetical protein